MVNKCTIYFMGEHGRLVNPNEVCNIYHYKWPHFVQMQCLMVLIKINMAFIVLILLETYFSLLSCFSPERTFSCFILM